MFSYPHGTHLCAIEVDTETGQATIRKYVAVDDVGVQVNPMIVEGQVHGGLAQGIAQALWEGAAYDEDGNLITASLADYLLPTAMDVPEYITDRTVTPSTTHPLGTKGVGEAGTIASTPAVINAVLDAIRHLGVQDVLMPCTPQTVWRAIQAAAGAHGRPREARHDPGELRLRRGRPRSTRRCPRWPTAGDDAKVITGGQSLLPLLRMRLAAPSVLVDCGRIEEMRGVSDDGSSLLIGAATTHHDVMHDPLVSEHAALLAAPTATVADPAIRHRGTFGGSLAHADPAGDLPTAALALDCTMVVAGPVRAAGGRRGGLLRRLLHHRPGMGRGAGRGPGTQTGCRLGVPTTRSSIAPRSPGRWSGWRRRSAGTTAPSREARIGADQHGRDPAAGRIDGGGAGRGVGDRRASVADAAQHAAEGTHPTSELHARPTTASTWPECSPNGRCWPRPASAEPHPASLYLYGKGVPRISAKNQVTIPVAALDEAGLRAGDQVVVEALEEGELRIRRGHMDFESAFGALTGSYELGYLKRLDDEDERR